MQSTWVFQRTRQPRQVEGTDVTQDRIDKRAWERCMNKSQTYKVLEEDQEQDPVRLILLHDTEGRLDDGITR